LKLRSSITLWFGRILELQLVVKNVLKTSPVSFEDIIKLVAVSVGEYEFYQMHPT